MRRERGAFVRLAVADADEGCEVDIAIDCRALDRSRPATARRSIASARPAASCSAATASNGSGEPAVPSISAPTSPGRAHRSGVVSIMRNSARDRLRGKCRRPGRPSPAGSGPMASRLAGYDRRGGLSDGLLDDAADGLHAVGDAHAVVELVQKPEQHAFMRQGRRRRRGLHTRLRHSLRVFAGQPNRLLDGHPDRIVSGVESDRSYFVVPLTGPTQQAAGQAWLSTREIPYTLSTRRCGCARAIAS